ncbi:helix-turn-helix transcriptional regulator [Streptomyces sp. NRRL B-24572]|uniref:helix-turn-helix transcriptional regulator n=1 Tax=Streptomyces sp. NRRL B-24572 TaxID=1962156 RepID=UPI000A3A3BF0|nr:helix-turn-helix transcriptional regulator [Streptomyces sp. NRRL B-24572]
MGLGDSDEGELGPEELMGLAGLLRAWRRAAGLKEGRGRAIPQAEVAHAIGMSEKWYGQLERGAVPRLPHDAVEKLVTRLHLGPDERQTLLYYTPGGALIGRARPREEPPELRTLQFLLDQQMPHPAYVTDARWSMIAYNRAMADWYPWVVEPDANLMRWALLHPDARKQYVGWEDHARVYLAMIRMFLARHKADRFMTSLLREIYEDPDCRRLWDESPHVVAHRDGNRFRMRLPRFDFQEVEVVSHLLFPAGHPDLRAVVITWLGSEHELQPGSVQQPDALSAGGAGGSEAIGDASWAQAGWADSAEDAAALAGSGAIGLPELSALAGPGCRLTLNPQDRTVVWAYRQDGGGWRVNTVSVEATLNHLAPQSSRPGVVREYQQLLRTTLPASAGEAGSELDTMIAELSERLAVLRDLRERLGEPVD